MRNMKFANVRLREVISFGVCMLWADKKYVKNRTDTVHLLHFGYVGSYKVYLSI